MKIIFLDIDGVMNDFEIIKKSVRGVKTNSNNPPLIYLTSSIGDAFISRLNKLVKSTGADVVVSSTWRKWYTLERMQQAFKIMGFEGTIVGVTPILETRRGFEIEDWIKSNENSFKVEKFVILDDDNDMEHLMDRLVLTSMFSGLTDEHVVRAIEMLKDE